MYACACTCSITCVRMCTYLQRHMCMHVHVLAASHVYACARTCSITCVRMCMHLQHHMCTHVHVLVASHVYACTCTCSITCVVSLSQRTCPQECNHHSSRVATPFGTFQKRRAWPSRRVFTALFISACSEACSIQARDTSDI